MADDGKICYLSRITGPDCGFVLFDRHSPGKIPQLYHNYFRPRMKVMLNIVKWSAIIAGVISIPILVKKRAEDLKRRAHDIRYDTNDYISDTTL